MSRVNIDIVRGFYDAVMHGDFARIMLDPQIEWIEPDILDFWFGGLHHGQDGVLKEVIEPTFERFDDFRIVCDDFYDAGDNIIVTGQYQGREKQTGRKLDASFAHIWRLHGGRAIRFRSITDTASWLHSLGYLQLEKLTGASK